MHLPTVFWHFQQYNDEEGTFTRKSKVAYLFVLCSASVRRTDMFTFSFIVLTEKCFESKEWWDRKCADMIYVKIFSSFCHQVCLELLYFLHMFCHLCLFLVSGHIFLIVCVFTFVCVLQFVAFLDFDHRLYIIMDVARCDFFHWFALVLV